MLAAVVQDPIYVGSKHRRVRNDAYWDLIDEFLTAVRRRYGSSGGYYSLMAVGCSAACVVGWGSAARERRTVMTSTAVRQQ